MPLGMSWTSGSGSLGSMSGTGPAISMRAFSDSGEADDDQITNETLPTWFIDFTGTDIEAGNDLQVYVDGAHEATVATITQFQIDGGPMNFGMSAFSDGTYAIKLRFDRGSNFSNFGNELSFTIDTTAPTLSSPTGTATGETTATVGVTTNEANGTLYVVVTRSATPPTADQIVAGTDENDDDADFADDQAIASTGAKTANATALRAGAVCYAHWTHVDAAGNQSSVSTSASFTTDDGTTPDTIFGPDLLAWYNANTQMSVSQWTDQSGNANHLLQAASGDQPTADANGLDTGKPGLVFTSAEGDFMETATTSLAHGTTELCVISVVKIPASGGEGRRWAISPNTADFSDGVMGMKSDAGTGVSGYRTAPIGTASISAATPVVVMDVWDGTNYTIYVDGVANTPVASTGTFAANSYLTLAARTGGTDARSITYSEMIVAKSVPNSGQRAALQAYCETEWSL
jgi:hypothetical protein